LIITLLVAILVLHIANELTDDRMALITGLDLWIRLHIQIHSNCVFVQPLYVRPPAYLTSFYEPFTNWDWQHRRGRTRQIWIQSMLEHDL